MAKSVSVSPPAKRAAHTVSVTAGRLTAHSRVLPAFQMRGNPGNLRRAAAKSAAAQARAEDGLQQMLRNGDPVTSRGLAQTAGVLLDFLYRTPEIRSRVEQLRARQPTTRTAPAPAPGQTSQAA